MVTVTVMEGLKEYGFEVEHLNSTIRRRNSEKGKLTLAALVALLRLTVRLWGRLSTRRYAAVYTILSQNTTGFCRDALLILSGAIWRCPIVAHLHGGNFHVFVRHSSWWMQGVIRMTVPRITRLVLLGDRLRRTVSGAVPDHRVRVVHTGIDADQLVNGRSFDSLWLGRRHASEGIRVVYIGLLSNAKGVGDLLTAIPAVLREAPTTEFVLAGEIIVSERNIARDEQGQIIRTDSVHDHLNAVLGAHPGNVSYLGVVHAQEKVELLSHADIFCMASYSEGMPFVLLEAMAFGLPIVTTPVGAIPDILSDPQHACFVPVGCPPAIADCLLHLVQDTRARRRMAEANYAYVRRNFSLAQMAKGIAAVFEEAMTARFQVER